MYQPGRHFLQIPGPTNTPDRVLRAMAAPTIDHRGAEFAALGREVLDGLKPVFQTAAPVVDLPGVGQRRLGSVARQHALARRRACSRSTSASSRRTGRKSRGGSGLDVEVVPGTGGAASIPAIVEASACARIATTASGRVLVVHNETSTGVTSRLPEIRRAIDAAGHPALLLVDAVSSLGSIDLRHDEWGLDVTLAGSQKGLMLPPGLSFNAISEKALAASRAARLPRSYWAWEPMLAANATGFFPTTPATNLLFGLREALRDAERGRTRATCSRGTAGWPTAARAAVRAWGLEILCEREDEYSPVVTTVMMPDGHDADRLPRDRARSVQHVARRRARPAEGPRVPHRPPRRLQRADADRHARRRRAGPGAAGVPFRRGGVDAALEATLTSRRTREHGACVSAR